MSAGRKQHHWIMVIQRDQVWRNYFRIVRDSGMSLQSTSDASCTPTFAASVGQKVESLQSLSRISSPQLSQVSSALVGARATIGAKVSAAPTRSAQCLR